MGIFVFILVALLLCMGAALYFQYKASRKQADEQQQLLTDYQHRVDEQQKLLSDYRALEKNFNNVGEGYEQALLAFDKLEEESQKSKTTIDALTKRCESLQTSLSQLQDTNTRRAENLDDVEREIQAIADSTGNMKLAVLVARIDDFEDLQAELPPIPRTDNELITTVVAQAVRMSGADQAQHVQFQQQVAEDAEVTMLSTNTKKAARALTHLLDNALKFSSEGIVSLDVTVDMMQMQASFAVTDSGTGIDPADAERIFEPYVKLNQYFDGKGIGLTVARNIARRLGGEITLDSTYAGPGCRFVLTLPI